MEVYSSKKTIMEDNLGNTFHLESFKLNINTNMLKAKKMSIYDNQKNKYYIDNALIDLENNKIAGNNISIDFDNPTFGDNQNEPRLKGRSVVSNLEETTVYKGIFTTCKKNDEKCPAWSIKAGEVTHKKKEKIVEYKNSWLEVYDVPILYFPYFYHPDPTVERKSGFLPPTFKNSNRYGTSVQIPYYKVISDDKDMTISPRVFIDNNLIFQTEYRQAFKGGDAIFDMSLNRENDNTKTHFFANINKKQKNKNYEINLQKVSNDNYLKKYKIHAHLIKKK